MTYVYGEWCVKLGILSRQTYAIVKAVIMSGCESEDVTY